jgi:hypothetical protein
MGRVPLGGVDGCAGIAMSILAVDGREGKNRSLDLCKKLLTNRIGSAIMAFGSTIAPCFAASAADHIDRPYAAGALPVITPAPTRLF